MIHAHSPICVLITYPRVFLHYKVERVSGQRYEAWGQSRLLRDAKRAAARNLLGQLPQQGMSYAQIVCYQSLTKPVAVSVGDVYSMIHALQRDGNTLRLEGESEKVEMEETVWKLYLHSE